MFTTLRRTLALLVLPTAVAALAAGPASAATASPKPATVAAAPQGILMSEGRICDPIRMGC